MKKLIFAVLVALAAGSVGGQTPRLRTDGYYYWHNGKDTILPFNNGGRFSVGDITVQMAFQHGIEIREVNDDRYHGFGDCIPSGLVFTDGSTFTHYIRFFGNGAGACTMSPCLGKSAVDAATTLLEDVRKGRKEVGDVITTLSLGERGGLYFEIYKPPALKEVFEGRVLADGLELWVEYPALKHATLPISTSRITRRYNFYKFGTYPAFDSK